MIISENNKPPFEEFKALMRETDNILNESTIGKEDYYMQRNGTDLEWDVFDAINAVAKNTAFEGSIQLVSGASFPDIVANKYYGVEVKSTNKNHWKSIGSSILESTRVPNVEHIFLTFGKLGLPIEFRSRPYEECLSGISVTHYPRYQIDMELEKGCTIFDKMGISYDDLRNLESPVIPVSKYYKSKLKPGESLWWAYSDDVDEISAPPTVKLWSAISYEEKEELIVRGYVMFPEILNTGNNKKYNRYALWLVTHKGVVNTSIRDSFSAGGRIAFKNSEGIEVSLPAAFGRINKYKKLIKKILYEMEEETLKEYWECDCISVDRVYQWCELVANNAKHDEKAGYDLVWLVLKDIFKISES